MPQAASANPGVPPAAAGLAALDLCNFKTAQTHIDRLVKRWTDVSERVVEARELRKLRVDVERLRASGGPKPALKTDETFIGVRVVDNNISKSIPPLIGYVKQSRRLAVFDAPGVPSDAKEKIEHDFMRAMTYSGWELDYIRWIDGAELNGWSWCEILYDDSKPGHVADNYVGTEELIFDVSVSNIQDSRLVMRRHRVTLVSFLELASKNQFDQAATNKIISLLGDENRQAGNTDRIDSDDPGFYIYRVYLKKDGVVYTAWYSKECEERWLREPKIFWNGVKQLSEPQQIIDPLTQLPVMTKPVWTEVAETQYPFFLLRKRVTEDTQITETQGRAEIDLYKQEAACSTWSTFINAVTRASKVMWAPEKPNEASGGQAPKQLSMVLADDAIWDQPMRPIFAPYPDAMLPKCLEMLETHNASDLNDPAWTVQNRRDSRKTATEIKASMQESVATGGVEVIMLSISMREKLTYAWRIIQSRRLQGALDGLFADIPDEIIKLNFSVKAAGDTDVIQRQEQVQMMQQDWPVFQATPVAGVFLEEYIRMRYPDTADRFIEALRSGDPKKQLIMSLAQTLQAVATDDSGQLRPELAASAGDLQRLAEQTQQVLAMP